MTSVRITGSTYISNVHTTSSKQIIYKLLVDLNNYKTIHNTQMNCNNVGLYQSFTKCAIPTSISRERQSGQC